MALRWMGCFAALAASAGMAAAQPATPDDSDAPKPTVVKPLPRELPPAVADSAPPVVLPPPPAAPCAAPSSCAGKLFEEAGRCGCDDDVYNIRANVDYLLWFFKRDHVPTLLGSIPPSLAGTNPLPPGSITSVFGGDHDALDTQGQSGARVGVEGWLDPGEHVGLDASYFQLESGVQRAGAGSGPNGLPIVGPTFFDPIKNQETLILFSEPGIRTSDLAVTSETRFWGVEANVRTRLPSIFSDRTELLVGFRHVQFDQNLDVAGQTTGSVPGAASLNYQDSFWVHDRFYGPQIGLDTESTYRRLFLNVKAKFAVGELDETMHIAGSTNVLPPFAAVVPGGVLAQRSNIGAYNHDICTFLPEITVNAGFLLTQNARIYAGYNLIYIDQLQRVGPAIDGVDATQVPSLQAVPNANASRPSFSFAEGRFWAQGLNAGLEFRY